ncbi:MULTISPECIES: DUF1292 domain-containing protein [Clostridium]|jgi:uncharacterized protein YrzB (UPF0473 family)|uniref:UPF0473 protein CLCOL_06130 n=2 Tax=Clostridium TaxID=1485 RepID=A0A151AQU2_9CLOT|nr:MULTISPECIES: DUF1292 domain-containing protein [Clostridium]KYH29975.1 hypothetical protein CLCOL_06130 [Clostridium colicanis DSM 13634]MBE6044182.1 DUF1292 domain-containing protein [Clostridium thermopalmarium]PRR75928.1 hypothetical protein CPAL_04190 [Clostridium thermopalmarium DSM 5974]PVZ24505.1 uncharacterized protein YrzB (UPF0473 family) [Clostridium thermopalmarium DSM 5974]
MENDFNTIVLKDENGDEVEFELIMKFDIEDKEYVIVAPVDDEEADAIAFRIDKDENGESLFVTIEDDSEFQMVQEAYETLSLEDDRLN